MEPRDRVEFSRIDQRPPLKLPDGLRLIKGFHDEALHGEWKGHRSSRLGEQYRVIYMVGEQKVLVMDVTAHDYRRKS